MESLTEKERAHYGYLEGAVSIVINLALSFVKFGVGFYINSIALIADGFHTLSDLLTSLVVIIGFKFSQQPPDEEHPFGHGRYEDIASLIIAILLAIVGAQFFISSIERLYRPEIVKGSVVFFLVILSTAAAKEILARYSLYLSRKINSHALLADAWHHRSDALAVIPVAFGILASIYGYYWVDAISGMLVSGVIVYVGYTIARDASSTLLGKAPPDDLIFQVKRLASHAGITDIHSVNVHHYGERKVISMHIQVEPMGLKEAHAIADDVEQKIEEELNASAVVHIDGFTVDESLKEEISAIVEAHKEVVSCHAVDVGQKIDFHILVDKNMELREAHQLAHHLEDDIAKKFRKDVVIHVEPCPRVCDDCSLRCDMRSA
ncbi:MAG: cation-efflux pump [Theionarchaea archaeon]|nr:cation-efflux pump [Theionarchaea archaeon]MBU7037969.1 cation-efflux pump [Theionarchaea archaeon]